MKIYLAPMEGITGFTYRNVYNRHFEKADKYFTPFISTHEKLGNKVINEILPENNRDLSLIPQIMVAGAEEAVGLEKLIIPYGYDELNINTGCPSGTVVNKARGAGLLRDPDSLDRALEEIFASCNCRFSIKTRLGWSDTSEWERIARVIGRYPFTEVIIHARVREEYYNGSPHTEAMAIAHEYIKSPLCYNGNIFDVKTSEDICSKFPWLDSIMVGRGILMNPLLIEDIKEKFQQGNSSCGKNEKLQSGTREEASSDADSHKYRNERVLNFMEDMLDTYLKQFGSEINTLYHMKELWSHLGQSYPEHEKELKVIRKTKKVSEYRMAVRQILS